MFIEPVVRELIGSCTPLYLCDKPAPGTGASLIADLLATIATGGRPFLMAPCEDEDEWRKRITSTLLDGPAVVVIDNLRRRLDSAALSAALTTQVWSDRILGQSRVASLPVTCTWLATANNAQVIHGPQLPP